MAYNKSGTVKEKCYNGKIRGDSFDIIHRCQSFTSDIFIASAGASKDYRFTICKVLQTYSCELIHTSRQANAIELGKPERQEKHREALELMEKISDLLPVIRRCRCISIGQEKELNNKLANLKIGYGKWVNSDIYRIKTSSGNK